jgi:hypothetical protein
MTIIQDAIITGPKNNAIYGYSQMLLTNAALSGGTGSSSVFNVTSFKEIDLLASVSAITGTSSLVFSINPVLVYNGKVIATVLTYASTTLTAAGSISMSVINETLGDYVQITWTSTGSLSGVYAKVVFK